MSEPIPQSALEQLFLSARTTNKFLPRPIDDATLRSLYATFKWAPTSINSQPGRFVFVRSEEAKARLKPALSPGNLEKTMAAPVTVIVAHDSRFFEHLPALAPHATGARERFEQNASLASETAFRNGTLQGAYLILAARALGLGAGPMSGFNPALVDAAFFPDGRWHANFLVNLGWTDPAGTRPRGSRLEFDEVGRIE